MANLTVEVVVTAGKALEGFAIFVSVADTNGEPVGGLTQTDIIVDVLAGNVNLSEATQRFIAPKPGFYILSVTAPLEANHDYVVSVAIAHPKAAGGTDNGQTVALLHV